MLCLIIGLMQGPQHRFENIRWYHNRANSCWFELPKLSAHRKSEDRLIPELLYCKEQLTKPDLSFILKLYEFYRYVLLMKMMKSSV